MQKSLVCSLEYVIEEDGLSAFIQKWESWHFVLMMLSPMNNATETSALMFSQLILL